VVKLPLFPLHAVLFPHAKLRIHVFEQRYRRMIGQCIESGGNFGVVLIKAGLEVGGPAIPQAVGTEAEMINAEKLPDGRYNLLVKGRRRFRISALDESEDYLQAEVEWMPEPSPGGEEFEELNGKAMNLFKAYVRYISVFESISIEEVFSDVPAEGYCFIIADMISIGPERKQELLQATSVEEILRKEIEILRVFSEKKTLPYVG